MSIKTAVICYWYRGECCWLWCNFVLKHVLSVFRVPLSYKDYDCGLLYYSVPFQCQLCLCWTNLHPENLLRQFVFNSVPQNLVRQSLLLFSSTCQYLSWSLALDIFLFFFFLLPIQVIFHTHRYFTVSFFCILFKYYCSFWNLIYDSLVLSERIILVLYKVLAVPAFIFFFQSDPQMIMQIL